MSRSPVVSPAHDEYDILGTKRETLLTVYTRLLEMNSDEAWIYEALGYIDELLETTADVAAFIDDNVAGSNRIDNRSRSRCSFADISARERFAVKQLYRRIVECLPNNFINMLTARDADWASLDPPDDRILDASGPTPDYPLQSNERTERVITKELLSGLCKWLLQIYLTVSKKVVGLIFEDLVKAIFDMANGYYQHIKPELLGVLLTESVVTCVLQNPDVKDRTIMENCIRYAARINTLTMPANNGRITHNAKKLLKKLLKKRNNCEADEKLADLAARTRAHFEQITESMTSERYNIYPHVHMENSGNTAKAVVCGRTLLIPSNHVKRTYDTYEEITIQPSARTSPKISPLIKISQLDPIGRTAFEGVEEFNEIQSEVFPVAYETNENMLICAPTGAGKTNIALMTVVHQIISSLEDNVLHLEKFKIVYICPMKALAAEITRKFSHCLRHLGVKVKEVSGDMQLSRREIMETQILVTTPEKWDVITRKGAADTEITSLLKLLILDEVHLLNGDRGPVIEALVARTLRQVVSTQSMIRIVGLSATIPNILDIADFLRVNRYVGLFYFDQGYKAIPISQTFIGVKGTRQEQIGGQEDAACFDKVKMFLREGHQVMVFVHARSQTVKYANYLKENAMKEGVLSLFTPENMAMKAKKFVLNTKTPFLKDLYTNGLGVHHAGMLRADRNEVERAFLSGITRVLVCTSTLAWGVNLPAHAVIIKGTTIYDTKKGAFVDVDILDIMQIFGRAGRPQFDTSGSAVLITSQSKIVHYLRLITLQVPIESQFLKSLDDNLNAEIILGTVSTVQEAVEWMNYTYFYLRLSNVKTVLEAIGEEKSEPLQLILSYVHEAAKRLDAAHMIRYNEETGDLVPTNLGRTASYFYINVETMERFNEVIMPDMTESDIIRLMCKASEFSQIQVRQEELIDLDNLLELYCQFEIHTVPENQEGKVNILMQSYISKGYITCLSLAADMEYITQSAQRIARALFEVALHKSWPTLATRCLLVAQMFEHRLWPFENLMKQFTALPANITERLERRNAKIDALREMDEQEIGNLINNYRFANRVKRYAHAFPMLQVETQLQPITKGVVRVKLFITPDFKWVTEVHGDAVLTFWVWVEDPDCNFIYHSESFTITKTICVAEDLIELVFTVPLASPPPSQYLVRISSDRWMGAYHVEPINFTDLKLPESLVQHTTLLPLQPLEVTVLNNELYESLYTFSHFNPVQSQMFHCLYHTDNNVLLGAPTGSGKTIAAELCLLRLFNTQPDLKAVYIAPLKALVKERVLDWKRRFGDMLGKRVVEITGDVGAGIQVLQNSDIIITTPEKWDALSRGWQNRNYVRDVGLIVIDEIHLLGEERGPVLEVIVSRTNFICNRTQRSLRIVGLSTAMANAGDLASWLGIEEVGLYNFQPSVRPVPLNVHVTGFPGKHYCPRMISMNRPAYQAIRQYAPDSPSLIFCSSRKQTRLTAFSLVTYLLTDSNPRQWLKCDPDTMEMITSQNIQDPDLKYFLNFGIGIHHAGLQEKDRTTVEELYVNQKIQVLICTSTLAWGVNFPAHLVIIKGTEYYDGNTKRYVDMPITDILQMMGRAGRPQFDTSGVACVFVHDLKKNFYKKFLYEPFPVESNLLDVLPDHANAEIVAGTIPTKLQFLEYLTWTYLFKRLHENPAYYNFKEEITPRNINAYLTGLVDSVIQTLEDNKCVTVVAGEDYNTYYEPTFLGTIASYYYLSHKTVNHFAQSLERDESIAELIEIMCFSAEYQTFPVRHNEDKTNQKLAKQLRYGTSLPMDSSHLKVILLMYTYLGNIEPPTREYMIDTKSMLDQALRILQAMLDITTNNGWLSVSLKIISVLQMTIQGFWMTESCLAMLPHVKSDDVFDLCNDFCQHFDTPYNFTLASLKCLHMEKPGQLRDFFAGAVGIAASKDIDRFLSGLPTISINLTTIEELTEKHQNIKLDSSTMYQFPAESSVEFRFQLNRKGSNSLEVHSKKFTKQKEESWVLIVGLAEEDVLLAAKKLSVKREKTASVQLKMPSKKGDYMLCVYLMSDSYIGLDQQYIMNVTVI